MPHANPIEWKRSKRDRYADRYAAEPGFADAEKERQRKIYEANRDRIIARVLARRAELKGAAGK